jgi:hypothetical protein
MSNQQPDVSIYESYLQVPRNLINQEIESLYGARVLREMGGGMYGHYALYSHGVAPACNII